MKKVSVIVPAYNKAELTVKTVESILSQDYQNIEIIVVNDGSTDDTEKKLQVFRDRIKYHKKDNGGACSARNFGISVAEGEYIALIDCDDVYYPNKISKSVQLLDSHPEFGFMHTAAKLIDDSDNIVGYHSYPNSQVKGQISHRLVLDNFINNPTVVIRKECFDKVGLFDESIFMPADWDMWIRLSEEFKAGYIDEPLSAYRITSNYTITHLELNLKEELYVLNKAFERGKIKSTKNLLKKSYAQMYYRMGKLYGVIGDVNKSNHYFQKAIINNKNNLKIVLYFFLSLTSPNFLGKHLKKRYYQL